MDDRLQVFLLGVAQYVTLLNERRCIVFLFAYHVN